MCVDVFPALLPAGDIGGRLLALEDLVGRPVDDLLGPLEAALVALPGPRAQDGLAAALGLLGDAGVLVEAENGRARVEGFGRRPDVLQGLVGVDAGGCGSARGAGVDRGCCESVSGMKILRRLRATSVSTCLRNCIPLPFDFAILLAVQRCCVCEDLEILVSIRFRNAFVALGLGPSEGTVHAQAKEGRFLADLMRARGPLSYGVCSKIASHSSIVN